LPVDEEEPASSGAASDDPNPPTFTINKQAGLVNIYAGEKAQHEVEAYLKLVKRAVTAQVLIEAKVLEVTLNDEYATGIDWSVVGLPGGEITLDFLQDGTTRPITSLIPGTAASLAGNTVASGSNFVLGYTGNDVQSLIQAIQGFGTVRALASPRLTVLNNQSAVLNVATNRVYFDVDIDVTSDDNGTQTDISSDIKNVPEGVLVNVQPSINLDDRTISMAVRPTITRIVAQQPDPAVQYVTAQNNIDGVENLVPELNVQEIDSVIQARSGQPVVMGGLLQDRITNTDTGIPVISETPLIGNLFKKHNNTVGKTELVIFLKATILDSPSESVHNTDKDLYRQFSSDRRPLKF
jgi:MSHA biogenesis protein MshL